MRLIDADALNKRVRNEGEKDASHLWGAYTNVVFLIEDAPTIDPVRHGRWLFTDTNTCECSVCHTCEPYPFSEFEWCPNCGARLEG